ncbi:MAG: HEPN domain-containing protein [Proteobacteria bacterium]|jgi:HEPN domain-containing protein|nr:HEPN domain-containing protein [Pseudomonadota bacterium]
MKQRRDLVAGWMAKAESDLRALAASLSADALDAACFHAQQAAEKALKAYLIHAGVEFPFTHNLSKLAALVASIDPALAHLADAVLPLTPYAVELRYDADFWPDRETADDARERAERVVRDIAAKLA